MVDQDKIMDIAKQLQGLDQDEQQKKLIEAKSGFENYVYGKENTK